MQIYTHIQRNTYIQTFTKNIHKHTQKQDQKHATINTHRQIDKQKYTPRQTHTHIHRKRKNTGK